MANSPKTDSKTASTRIARGRIKRRTSAVRPGQAGFPRIDLPVTPPYFPMEAKSVDTIPVEGGYLFEPKWDGFRCLAFRYRTSVLLQSKAGRPLGRYFPEIVSALGELPADRFVLDGELAIFTDGILSFDELLQRIHPADSRIRKLSISKPARLMCFDLLVDGGGRSLVHLPLSQRRQKLEKFFRPIAPTGVIRLSPASVEIRQARRWMRELAKLGLDGVIAKRLAEPYRSGERTGMVKIKSIRTADCVVGGFRYTKQGAIGSLLLGLTDKAGLLDHVGFTSSFNAKQRKELTKIVEPLMGSGGFSGSAPGGPSRWASDRSSDWQPIQAKLVCEVSFDHFSEMRFRHGTKFLRWRPDKRPDQCTFDQVKLNSQSRARDAQRSIDRR